jgi:hypothetical protein
MIEALTGRKVVVYFDRHRDPTVFGKFPGSVLGTVVETASAGIVLRIEDDEGRIGSLFFPWHIINNVEIIDG